jgi:hypothetical protein
MLKMPHGAAERDSGWRYSPKRRTRFDPDRRGPGPSIASRTCTHSLGRALLERPLAAIDPAGVDVDLQPLRVPGVSRYL